MIDLPQIFIMKIMKGKSDAEGIKVEIGGFYYEHNMVDHGCKQRIRKRDDKAALRKGRHGHRYREKYKQGSGTDRKIPEYF